jgi:hypothetical protein
MWLFSSGKARPRTPDRPRRPYQPRVESLEARLAPAVLKVDTTADNITDTSVLTLRDAISLVNSGGDPTPLGQSSMPAGWASQIDITNPFGSNDTIQFNIPWNDRGHFYYKDDGIPGHVSTADVAPVPTVGIDGVTPITTDAQLADPGIVGAGNTIDPDWQHSWWAIQPSAGLPPIIRSVVLDGTTQPGWQGNSLPVTGPTAGDNAVLTIVLDGSLAGSVYGLEIGGGNSRVRGLVIDNFVAVGGIHLGGSGKDTVAGNFIGTDPTGTIGAGNRSGIVIESDNNIVGGTAPADRNIIVTLGRSAVYIVDSNGNRLGNGNRLEGNYIGTDATGTRSLGIQTEGNGVYIQGGSSNTIGGSAQGAGNLIAGWPSSDVLLQAGADSNSNAVPATNNVVQGNFLGTNAAGTAPIASANGPDTFGVDLKGPDVFSNTITGNLISGHASAGVIVEAGIPINSNTSGNAIRGNSIFANAGLGIDLGGSGVPILNDSQGHAGPNNFQDFPVLASASTTGTSTTVTSTFREADEPDAMLTLDFYANPSPDPSGYGQGQTYLGSTTVMTDNTGNTPQFSVDFPVGNLANQWLTATATGPDNSTSEFSADVPILAPNQTFAQFLQAVLPQSSTAANSLTIPVSASAMPATVIQAVNGLTNVTQPVTIILDLGGGTYSTGGITANPPPNVTFVVRNGTLDPSYPAVTVAGGHVSVLHCTLTTSGAAPTILVSGGSLTLRGDVVQESTGFTEAAISVTGGTLDLGTVADPGGNTLNVNGAGEFVHNTTANLISAVGDTFTVNGTPLAAPTLSFTSVAASAATTLLNQPVTFTATVRPDGAGTPSGTVDFVDTTTDTDLGSVVLSGGTASLTTTALTAGNHTIQVRYTGDGTFLPSLDAIAVRVHYNFSGFLAPLNSNLALALNRTAPIKFQLTDYNGNPITSLSPVASLQVAPVVNGVAGTPFTPASTNNLGLESVGGQYLFTWQTKGLSAGTYEILLTLADGTTHTKTIPLTAPGSGANAQAADGSDGSGGSTAGQLLGGDLEVYVSDPSGQFTADELARIQDAVNAVDAVVEPFGVSVAETTDSTPANVTINTGSSSAVGGYADGVLGCYTTAGEVTLIQGWDWYAAADPAQIGSGQYDFQTTLTHELGHALGLGESSNSGSAMYGTLAPGTVIRTLTTADLNLPYDEADADAQRAAVTPPAATDARPAAPPAVTESAPANAAKVAVPDHPADVRLPAAVRLAEAAVLGSVKGGTDSGAAAAGAAAAGWPATLAAVGGNVQSPAATFGAWATQPPTAGGGDADAPVAVPALADPWCPGPREPGTQEGAPRREQTELAPSPEQRDARSPAALDASFRSGTGDSAGVGGALGGLGDGNDAREVEVPAAGKSSLFALLGALWGNLWGARTDEPESRKQRRQRRR